MKRLIVLIGFLQLLTNLHAQNYLFYEGQPGNPLIGGFTYEKRLPVDTVYFKTYDANEELTIHCGKNIYIHSEDGLRDTILSLSGSTWYGVEGYDLEGRLLSRKELVLYPYFTDSVQKKTSYRYDSRGRIISQADSTSEGIGVEHLIYNDSSIVRYYNSNKEDQFIIHILYTDSGFITESGIGNVKKEYVFDSQKRLVRFGNSHYNYFENGYTEITAGVSKIEYYFNANGYKNKKITYLQKDGQWVLKETEMWDYAMHEDSQSNILPVEPSVLKTYGVEGGVMVLSDKPECISVYNLNGRLMKKMQTISNREQIPLSKGLYLVKVGNDSYKVLVR